VLHVLDALIHLAGPARPACTARARCSSASRPAPLDTVSAIYEFANGPAAPRHRAGDTALLETPRFGANGSAEALGENELVLHGAASRRLSLEPVDSLLAERKCSPNAIETRARVPISAAQMLATGRRSKLQIRIPRVRMPTGNPRLTLPDPQ